jgi:hypothetical protein
MKKRVLFSWCKTADTYCPVCENKLVWITKAFNLEWLRKGYKGYKDGLQPEFLADGNWLVKQNQPVSKIETKSDTNLRSLYES